MTNIAIVTPIYFNYTQPFVGSLLACLANARKYDLNFGFISPCGCSNVTQVRNLSIYDVLIYEENIKQKFDYLLFVDSDIIYSLENIVKLLSHKKDIISGLYFTKAVPYHPVAGYYDLNKVVDGFPKITKEQVISKSLIEIDWAGLGFFMMKRDIVDKMEYPWFEMKIVDLPVPMKKQGGLTIKKEILSEDISFCNTIRNLGCKIYIDTSTILKHTGNSNFSIDHFLAVQ